MPSEFLLKEYDLCFEQLRFYDARQEELLKYLFTLTSATAAAQFAVLQFLTKPCTAFFAAQGFLFSVVFTASVLLYLMMLQNRLYFVFIARQINAIRKQCCSLKRQSSPTINVYLDVILGFKWSSSQPCRCLARIDLCTLPQFDVRIPHTMGSQASYVKRVCLCGVGLTERLRGGIP
jgi:hypothetical protein